MEKKILLYVVLTVSIIINIVLLAQKCSNFESSNAEDIKELASAAIKNEICKNLYIPESYDPVEITVDSMFNGILLDDECLQAASTLIDKRSQYSGAKSRLEEAEHTLKIFGSSSVFWRNRQDRDDAKSDLEEIEKAIEDAEKTIRSKKNMYDKAEFLGWIVSQRYRAKNNNGVVSFDEKCYCFDKTFEHVIAYYSVDKKDPHNIYEVANVIEELLTDEEQ